MVKYSSLALAVALFATSTGASNAFVLPTGSSVRRTDGKTSTSLNAFTPPTMIIGPMIRKMREDKEKKKMPMASAEERAYEAAGLRVGAGAWKWPPVWPYDPDFFKRKEEIANKAQGNMASMLTGVPQMPTAVTDEENENLLDSLEYWGEDKAEATTDLEEEAVENLKSHYSYYLRDGMSILELGAAENSYLPDGLKPSRHVGVGASKALMEKNPSFTEPALVVDLNDVVKDDVVNSDELKSLSAEPFDAVIMANTIDFLTNPREVFRTAWYLLKPGGIMIVPFSSKDAAYSNKFDRAQTKMWRDMTNDQHMWICGSFFHFSAGDGWEALKGFDISPAGSIDDEGPLASFMNRDKPQGMYVVQATKGFQDDSVDESDPEKSFRSKMWMLPTLETRDKMLTAPRLARAYEKASSEEEKAAIGANVDTLPKIYESLVKMDQFAFTFSMQAQCAVDVASDPDFSANYEQIDALKQGLGLKKPSENFWAPVGEATAAMNADDKINLLAHIVPRFGSGNPEQEKALESFVSGLKPTFAVIRTKCPDLSESDVQLLGTELLAAEVLKPERSTRSEFATWLGALSDSELKEILAQRRSFKEDADAELKQFREARAAYLDEVEGQKNKQEEQIKKARKERTMALNPATGKMERIKERK